MSHNYPSSERIRDLFNYDPDTGVLTWKMASSVYGERFVGKVAGSTNREGYRTVKIDRCKYQVSWVVWIYVTGKEPENEIDHKNLNRGDDRFDNLRESTRSQNCSNKSVFFKKNRYGFRGVKKNWNKFSAVICVDQKEHCLGVYDTPEDAARAYDVAAIERFGQFARVNFPEPLND